MAAVMSARADRMGCRGHGRRIAAVGVAALCLLAAAAAPAHAQAPQYLEPGHWSYDVLRRFSGLGLAPVNADPLAAPMTVHHVHDVLTRVAASEDGYHAAVARHWLALLAAEADTAGRPHARLQAGWMRLAGEALAGDGYFREEDWEGARRIENVSSPAALLTFRTSLGQHVGASLQAGYAASSWTVPFGALSASVGPVNLWAGRRRLSYGVGRGGGTVLGSGMAEATELTQRTLYSIDGAGIESRDAFSYPGVLGFLGSGRVEVAVGRLPRNGIVESPFVAFGRFTATPFTPRITIGFNRGAIFGGRGNAITAGRLAGLVIGLHGGEGGEFENQVFSGFARVRPPLGSLPLEAYAEWGMDDTAGAFRDTPGLIGGIDLAAVPGLPAIALGLEAARFPESCCGNPIWYRSVFFRGSWADEGRLIAHPLGGHGSELLGHVRVDLPGRGVWLQAQGFTRSRGGENLFAPEREGRSRGGSIVAEYRAGPSAGVRLHAGIEDGAGWSRTTAAMFVTYSLTRNR